MDIVAGMGLVESVETGNAAAEAAADAAVSDTEIVVESADIFETDTGAGQLSVGGVVYSYTDVDPDTGSLTLAAPLSVAVDAGDQVEVYPPAPQTLAVVTLDSGDAVTARVAAAHVPLLPEGDRNGQGREFVTLYREGERYVTLDVPNAKLQIDPAYIPTTGGDIDPEVETVLIDGPPDFYAPVTGDSASGDESAALVDYATMLAATGSAWAALVSGVTFVDGTLTLSRTAADELDDATFPSTPYFPVWLVPTSGRSARVITDSLTATRPTPGVFDDATLGYQMADGSATMTALVDDFQQVYDHSSPYTTLKRDRFVGYQSAHGGGLFQTPPYRSFTAEESVADGYFSGTIGSHVAVVVAYPLWSWYSGVGGTSPVPDATWVYAGVRVELG